MLGRAGTFSVGCGTEMSAYRVDIRRLILSSTRDLRASLLFRFMFRVENCFWSLGPVDLPVRRDVGCEGAMVPIPTGGHPPCSPGTMIATALEVFCYRVGRLLRCIQHLPTMFFPRLTLPFWHPRMTPASTGSRELRKTSAMSMIIQEIYPLIITLCPFLRHFFNKPALCQCTISATQTTPQCAEKPNHIKDQSLAHSLFPPVLFLSRSVGRSAPGWQPTTPVLTRLQALAG